MEARRNLGMRRGGVACNAGGRQAAPLQRVEDEDEFEDEDDWLRLRRARRHAGSELLIYPSVAPGDEEME